MAKTAEPHSPEKLNRIVAGTQIEGEINTDSNIRIDGSLKGKINAKGRLVVGPTGSIQGEIVCENADIEGKINGKISVNGLLSLKSTARLECDILTQKLAIEPGATFSGNCAMGSGNSPIQNRNSDAQAQNKTVEPRPQSQDPKSDRPRTGQESRAAQGAGR